MKKATSHDVARKAGVSQSTVSFVMNNVKSIGISGRTRERVISAARELGYGIFSKNELLDKEVRTVAVMVPNISNPFYPMLLTHIENALFEKGYTIMLCNTGRDLLKEKAYIELISTKILSGVIYAFTPQSVAIVQTLTQKNVPVIILGEAKKGAKVDCVSFDSHKAGEIAAQHLLELGHKSIAFITSPPDSLSMSRRQRMAGVEAYIQQNSPSCTLHICIAKEERDNENNVYEFETGLALTKKLIHDHPEVTGLIGVNDVIATGIMAALVDLGIKVPQQMSVMGFDNSFLSKCSYPKLTTVDQCIKQRAELAVQMLTARLEEEEISEHPHKATYDPILLRRDSTGKAPI